MDMVECYDDGFGNEIETFKCACGRSHSVYVGGEPSCCPCEFENEGREAE